MTNIGKNIRQLRQGAGLSQEQLAEKLIVTRQAVSGWEVGRSQPDIEMLEAIAAALDTDINEVIYGKKPESEPYNKLKYKIAALVCGLLTVAALVVMIFFEPDLQQAYYRFQDGNLYMWWLLIFKPVFGYLAISGLVFSLISLRADIRLRKLPARLTCLWLGVVFIFCYILLIVLWLGFGGLRVPHIFLQLPLLVLQAPQIFLLPGALLFLGLNK
ncbi:MAG: helix-turn-helix transcriptional regulator [Clostridia bacterium]|nr:helix-turn-helix transcriptional regulator [Clostridia bacterium]